MNTEFIPCPAPFNMAAHVLAHADRLGDKVALAIVSNKGAKRYHYAQIKSHVLAIARGFQNMGLVAGDRVLMRLGNCVEFPLTYLAALAVDMVPVPTSSQLTADEVQKIVDEVAPSVIVRSPDVACPATTCPVIDTAALQSFYTNPPAEFVFGDPDRLGYIVYTSGTSGRPQAVMHAHRAIWARQMMIRDWYDLCETDRLLHAGAFNWTFTLGTGVMDPWTVGATALIPQAGTDASILPLLLKRFDATIFAAAPGVYRKALQGFPNNYSLPKLRHGLSAGEKLPPRTSASWAERTGTRVYEAFGMSECSTFISANPTRPATTDVLGWPQRGRQVAIVDPDTGHPVTQGTEGVIAIHNTDTGLMLGYWNAPDATAEKFKGDWFLTGDFGVETPDGAIAYLGRRDDMMNAGGIRVSPIEVETQLLRHPDITSVAVTDIEIKPDTFIIVAFYTGSRELTHAEMTEFCKEALAQYKQPRAYVRLDALPTNPNGKISRKALKTYKDMLNGKA